MGPDKIEIFNLLHDGVITDIRGSIPGELTLVVDCEYLRERIPDLGNAFLIRLGGCSSFRYETNSSDRVIEDLSEIVALQCDILSAEKKDEEVVVYTGPGQLVLMFNKISVATNESTSLSVEDLNSVATSYWTDWENGWRARRLVLIIDRFLSGKFTLTEAVEEGVKWGFAEVDKNRDLMIRETWEVLQDFAQSTPCSPSRNYKNQLVESFDRLKLKYP